MLFRHRKEKPQEEAYTPILGEDTPVEDAPAQDAEMPQPAAPDEMVTLEDGRMFPRTFYEEIRRYDAPDLRVILDEQRDLYTPEEYAYIEEVFDERLGDLN